MIPNHTSWTHCMWVVMFLTDDLYWSRVNSYKALSTWFLVDMFIVKPTVFLVDMIIVKPTVVLGCFWSWNNWQKWNTLNTKESIRNPWNSCWNALSMSINAPCTCKKMFQTVTTKQTETRHHTQISPTEKVEGAPSTQGESKLSASGSKVFMILAPLTVSGFVTKNDVKSYKSDTLIVRCKVSHLYGLCELTLTHTNTMNLYKQNSNRHPWQRAWRGPKARGVKF